jgi:hypothetical protein
MQSDHVLTLFVSRWSLYVYGLIGLGLFVGFLYLFNFTTFFGPLRP